jgi:hypothetical protein
MNGIADLSSNITISMLSSYLTWAYCLLLPLPGPPNNPMYRTASSTLIDVTYNETYNIYQYDSHNLIVSYSIAIFFAVLAVLLGIFSLVDNGVVHSTAFSAVVATTRNTDLDALSKGHSLGALPLDKGMADVKLRFGELGKGDEWRNDGQQEGEGAVHIGFGLENGVARLREGGTILDRWFVI